jgi:hypothetical protein
MSVQAVQADNHDRFQTRGYFTAVAKTLDVKESAALVRWCERTGILEHGEAPRFAGAADHCALARLAARGNSSFRPENAISEAIAGVAQCPTMRQERVVGPL